MVDCFDVLGIARRASLSTDEVRAGFQQQGAKIHPDGAGDPDDRKRRETSFQQLTEAYSLLTSTPRRLKHLLELLAPGATRGGVLDESLMGLFGTINSVLQKADALLAKKAQATSALAKALLAAESLETEELLATAAGELLQRQEVLDAKLTAFDAADSPDPAALAGLAQEAAFLEKWESQIQQRRLRLID